MMHWLMDTQHGAVFMVFLGVLVLLVLYLVPSLLAWTQGLQPAGRDALARHRVVQPAVGLDGPGVAGGLGMGTGR